MKQPGQPTWRDPGLLVLTTLVDRPRHGYSVVQEVRKQAGITLGPGTLYGALSRLESYGLVESLPADLTVSPRRGVSWSRPSSTAWRGSCGSMGTPKSAGSSHRCPATSRGRPEPPYHGSAWRPIGYLRATLEPWVERSRQSRRVSLGPLI